MWPRHGLTYSASSQLELAQAPGALDGRCHCAIMRQNPASSPPEIGEEKFVEISRSQNGDIIILEPSGRIDQDSSAAFQEALSGEIVRPQNIWDA